MLKVLLIDDEPFILQGLKVLVDWEAEDYEVVKTAENGKDALAYLKENEVDLIISDIKMPEMSGLELMEKIRKDKISDAYFVILSGYNDFYYAQQAMQYDCLSYILKPVEKEELLELIRKVAKMSEKSRAEKQNRRQMERVYLERNLLAILMGKYDDVIMDYVRKHMQLSAGVRYVHIEFEDRCLECEDDTAMQLQRKLHQSCITLLEEDEAHVVCAVARDGKIYDNGFIYCDYMAEKNDCTEEEFLVQFHKKLENEMQKKITMLVGKKVADISSASKSYSTACILKSVIGFREKKSIYFYDREAQIQAGGENGVVLCKKSIDDLILAIEQNEKIKIRKCVDNLYEEIRQAGAGSNALDLNINYLLFQLIHLATEQDDGVNQEEVLQHISESSFEEGFLRGSNTHLSGFACNYADYLMALRKNVSRGVLADIEKEIKEHYMENINLANLSKKYYLNSSYLGQIFRKQYGQSFKDYLSHYRINEAVKLLLYTDKKIIRIAEEVGYKDSDYFIRKFIEIKGCTPSKFRKKMNGE